MIYEISVGGRDYAIELKPGEKPGEWLARVAPGKDKEQREFVLSAASSGEGILSLLLDGKSYELKQDITTASRYVSLSGQRYEVEVRDPRSLRNRRKAADAEHGPRKVVASMPGKVVRVLKPEGSAVEAGQGLMVVEAMKMQNELKSPKKGTVKKIYVPEGAAVNAGDALAMVE